MRGKNGPCEDVLADQLLANANDPSWYMPFSDAVKDLSERSFLETE